MNIPFSPFHPAHRELRQWSRWVSACLRSQWEAVRSESPEAECDHVSHSTLLLLSHSYLHHMVLYQFHSCPRLLGRGTFLGRLSEPCCHRGNGHGRRTGQGVAGNRNPQMRGLETGQEVGCYMGSGTRPPLQQSQPTQSLSSRGDNQPP